jgi:uncharacterized OB-fold protein
MPAEIPKPQLDTDSREYWEGLARGELRIQRCDSCARHVFYPRAICPHCFSSELSWVTATGKGTIYSYTVAHQGYGAFAQDVPFVVAIVELEEDVRMMTRIVGSPREQVAIGARVEISFEKIDEDLTLPYFRLTGERVSPLNR